jgi:hypothetical protein
MRMRYREDDMSARTTTTKRHNGKHNNNNNNTVEEPHHLDPLRHQAEGDDGDLRVEGDAGDDAEGVPSPFSIDMASLTEAVLRLVAQLHHDWHVVHGFLSLSSFLVRVRREPDGRFSLVHPIEVRLCHARHARRIRRVASSAAAAGRGVHVSPPPPRSREETSLPASPIPPAVAEAAGGEGRGGGPEDENHHSGFAFHRFMKAFRHPPLLWAPGVAEHPQQQQQPPHGVASLPPSPLLTPTAAYGGGGGAVVSGSNKRRPPPLRALSGTDAPLKEQALRHKKRAASSVDLTMQRLDPAQWSWSTAATRMESRKGGAEEPDTATGSAVTASGGGVTATVVTSSSSASLVPVPSPVGVLPAPTTTAPSPPSSLFWGIGRNPTTVPFPQSGVAANNGGTDSSGHFKQPLAWSEVDPQSQPFVASDVAQIAVIVLQLWGPLLPSAVRGAKGSGAGPRCWVRLPWRSARSERRRASHLTTSHAAAEPPMASPLPTNAATV